MHRDGPRDQPDRQRRDGADPQQAVIAAPQLAGHHAEARHACRIADWPSSRNWRPRSDSTMRLAPPLEDQEAQLGFERADQAADGGLAEAEIAGGARHRAGFAYGECCAQLQEIERAVAGRHVMRLLHELIRTYHFSA